MNEWYGVIPKQKKTKCVAAIQCGGTMSIKWYCD